MVFKQKKQLTPVEQSTKQTTKKRSIAPYVRDIRSRVLWFGGSVAIAAVIGFEFKDIFQGIIAMPLNDLSLMNLDPAIEGQSTILMSILVAVLVGLAVLAYHVYRFFEPMFDKGDLYAAKLLGSSLLAIVLAIVYAFGVTIPTALHGMAAPGNDAILAHITTESFLTFATVNLIATMVLFQVPLFVVFINSILPLGKKTRRVLRGIILPASVIIAIIATPFTTINRGIAGVLLVALPTIILFEVSMLWAKKHAKATVISKALQEEASDEAVPSLTEQLPAIQAVRTSAPATHAPVLPKTIPETEQLESFPDDILEAVIEEKAPVRSAAQMYPSQAQQHAAMIHKQNMIRVQQQAQRPVAPPAFQRPVTPVQQAQAAPTFGTSTRRFGASIDSVRGPQRSAMQTQVARPRMTASLQQRLVVSSAMRNQLGHKQTIPFRVSSATV